METSEHSHSSPEEHSVTEVSHDSQTSPSERLDKWHNLMLREDIVGPAWELVMNTSFIKKFNFFPSLLTTIYLGCIILYQLAFTYVNIFQLKDQFFAVIIQWVHTVYFWQFLGALGLGVLLYILITPVAEWGLIALIAKRQDESFESTETKGRIGYGVSQGLIHFLPIFELHNFLALFKLLSIITFYILLLRVFGKDYFMSITIFMAVYLGFAFLVNILFSYARFFIIFENKKALESLSLSVRMALMNLEITFHLYFTLLLVYIRTFLTALIFIVFPFIISALFTYITISLLQIISIGILALLFLALLVFISHLNSVVEIFVEAIWYNAYRKNKKHFEVWESVHHEAKSHH